ncbi:adenylate/guanylate cyclase domain-containing protein [Aeromicrobium sp.]|uniref:adenylate/guanylate cyclase domain-containing protein n=1 Tax=Aeromicrobium sp. TaxID=1871063 RepID=UPI0030C630B1
MTDAPHDGISTGDLDQALAGIESFLLGEAPTLTRGEVAELSGVSIELAEELWRLLGFPHAADDEVAFTPRDVQALRLTKDLMALGILSPERQAALVRTWGRSFARLAEWQTALLADVAAESADPAAQISELAEQVLPRVEELQDYVWRRHLAGASSRLLAMDASGDTTSTLAVGFVDIVGFTSRSKELTEAELVGWLEDFESQCSDIVTAHGGRIIKSIGDAVLYVAEDLTSAIEGALEMVGRGADEQAGFPEVRAGLAYGEVVPRLGDVFGPTVNIASRLTSLARPGTVLVDVGAHDALTGHTGDPDDHHEHGPDTPFELRRLRRTSVKGYSRLRSWAVRRPHAPR